jgi:hypothetical protein
VATEAEAYFFDLTREHRQPGRPNSVTYEQVRLKSLGIPRYWPAGKEADYYHPAVKPHNEPIPFCLECLHDFEWRQKHPGIQRRDRIHTDGKITMVCSLIGDLARPPSPGITYVVDEDGLKRFHPDIFHAPRAPIDEPTQTDGSSSTYQPESATRWVSRVTQTETSGTKEQAVQTRTDVLAQYGTTAYWLEKRTGRPNAPQGSTHPEPHWQVAVHHHGLDRLGLDSGGLHGFSDSDSDKYEEAKRAILDLDYCSYHKKRGDHKSGDCLCPHIKCLPHWGKCYVPTTHQHYGGGCLMDDTIEGVRRKRKQYAALNLLAEASSSRRKTDSSAGGTAG